MTTGAPSGPETTCTHLPDLLEPRHLALGFLKVVRKRFLQGGVIRTLCHLGNGFGQLFLCGIEVFNLVGKQVFNGVFVGNFNNLFMEIRLERLAMVE
jgi:hypothetical protein